ncbi:MAG: cache domain-containing protein [Pseudomonadota bacterium]
MKSFFTACSIVALAVCAGSACAAEPTAQDAIAMVERGAALIKSKGKAEMMKMINIKHADYVQGSLYIDMRDLYTGIVLAHPINPSIVGKDLTNIPDANGKVYRREIIELAQKSGKGWVDYQYKNPTSGKIEPKTTYILRVDDVVLEAGIYKAVPTTLSMNQ